MHQIASFKTTFSKKLLLLRGHIPLRHPPASRKRDGRRLCAIFYFKKNGPPHFENRSAAYAHRIVQGLGSGLRHKYYVRLENRIFRLHNLRTTERSTILSHCTFRISQSRDNPQYFTNTWQRAMFHLHSEYCPL